MEIKTCFISYPGRWPWTWLFYGHRDKREGRLSRFCVIEISVIPLIRGNFFASEITSRFPLAFDNKTRRAFK